MTIIFLAAIIWTIPWKGIALWRAAQNQHRVWFVILLVVNTLAVLDILYIFIFSKKEKLSEQESIQIRKIV